MDKDFITSYIRRKTFHVFIADSDENIHFFVFKQKAFLVDKSKHDPFLASSFLCF